MKANNDDIKCHLKKISSCEHYGYLMDCLTATLHLLSTYMWLHCFFPPYCMVKCQNIAVDIIRTKYGSLLQVVFLHHRDLRGLQSCTARRCNLNWKTNTSFEQDHRGLSGLVSQDRGYVSSFCCTLGTSLLLKTLKLPTNHRQVVQSFGKESSSPLAFMYFWICPNSTRLFVHGRQKKLHCSIPCPQQKVVKSPKLPFFVFILPPH